MKSRSPRIRSKINGRLFWAVGSGLLVLLASCEDGDDGQDGAGPATPPTRSELMRGEDPPGINIAVLALGGASGASGNFQVGDTLRVTYGVTKDDGSDWDISEFSRGRILVSGPTFNYQRVITEQSDLHTVSVDNGDGTYTYTMPVPIPDTYLAPYNDTPDFDETDGELTGMPLLAGTYTVGMYFGWDYTIGVDSFRDYDNLTSDFRFGAAAAIAPRELVTQANCNQCHDQLDAHGGQRRDVTLCLMCHTSGAEDRNNPMVAGGTPGATIDFRVMIHKIHNGKHLPSVMGMETNMDGSRNYAGTPTPYELVGFGDRIHDYSNVAFPVWPSLSFPTPRDTGHSMLGATEQGMEDLQRTGPVSCHVCHGDPDGAGPLPPPADGDLAYLQPTRRACGACHDDIDWDLPYTANSMTMPAIPDDSTCTQCHGETGSPLDIRDGHLHPLLDMTHNPGLNFAVADVSEAGMNDGSGTIDPGEKIAVTFTITDDMAADVDPADLDSISMVLTGPTWNLNLIQNSAIPTAALTGPQPFVINLPAEILLEFQGYGTAGMDAFGTARTPHWDVVGAETAVHVAEPMGGASTTLAAEARAPQNFLDVADATGFLRDEYVAVEVGGMEEYLQIQWVDGDRLWFSSPYQTEYKTGLQFDHMLGATVDEVDFTELTAGVDYTLDPLTGTVTEVGGSFGPTQAVIVSYTSDFVMPAEYPLALNDSPGLDETWGEWAGLSLVDGTYRLGLWGYRTLAVDLVGESNSYRAASDAVNYDLLVGTATQVEPYDLISSANNCKACHQDLYFHGGTRRGFEACLQCHGNAGTEDRPRYRAANAPETPQLSAKFRSMLHSIHAGEELTNASTYTIVGFGLPFLYPDNFSEHTYEEVLFPTLPDGVRHCLKCHGEGNTAYVEPRQLDHPTEQGLPSRSWSAVCSSCHDSAAERQHMDSQTSAAGVESCAVCHKEGTELGVDIVHKPNF